MGVYWSFTMPLLSTLAALVIIVHSAEEDFEEIRRDLRPRVADTGTTNYELPWRAVRAEPMMTQSSQTDTWDGSPEEQPKRRRPSRKRRRRPQPSSEVFASQEGYSEQREYPYNGENYRPFTQIPQRRRKKLLGNEPVDGGRPSRRKNVRRKANADEPWRELSEFGEAPVEEYVETNEANQKTEPTNYEPDFENNDGHVPRLTLNHFFKYDKEVNQDVAKDPRSYEENDEEPMQLNKDTEYDDNLMTPVKEDKSLSEFSMEINDSARTSRNRSEQVKPFKGSLNDLKEQRPLDPSSLKEILKKSKGKSLSELLQQHNLTLADLLNGEKKVLSVLKSSDTLQTNKQASDALETPSQVLIIENPNITSVAETKVSDQDVEETTVTNYKLFEITTPESSTLTTIRQLTKKVINTPVDASKASQGIIYKYKGSINESSTTNLSDKIKLNETNKNFLRRRLPGSIGMRMKLRMRPLNSNSYKGQLSRDLIALTSKRFQHSRNITKLRDWKDLIPVVLNKTQTKSEEKQSIYNNEDKTDNSTTTARTAETTTDEVTDVSTDTDNESDIPTEVASTNQVPTTTIPTIEETTAVKVTTMLNSLISKRSRMNTTSLRNEALTNRLRRKKLRQKVLMNETTPDVDHKLKDIFDMANLVSASEFIAKIQQNQTVSDETESVTMLEDFITTEITTKAQLTQTSTKRSRMREIPQASTTPRPVLKTTSTESAKIELEEILDDATVRDRLSQILMERNMSLSELVEHRERGSSHVHLADIFHNASKEPNPPEPFLSKSLLEPISKETYPLRALLEANSHEQTVKPTTVEPYLFPLHYINVPIAMDFGNNVNENSENSGIIALFNNFTTIVENVQSHDYDTKSDEDPKNEVANSTRESRVFNTDQDLISLNEIFSLMQKTRNHRNEPDAEISSEVLSSNKSEIDSTVEDIDGDGLIALEDLRHIKDMKIDNDFYSDKAESKLLESIEAPAMNGTPEILHGNTRSVTVVTASIVGLIAVLFLVTYAIFKWKHQQQAFRKKHCTSEDRIPTPIFENRKSNKNSSMRSMSPMLSSNIYSVNTLEKPNNNECPEYMWDSLRKPFQ